MLSNSLVELDRAYLARTIDDTLADAEVRAALQY
jgi:hypothetical protein